MSADHSEAVPPASEETTLPLFPLQAVLFPGMSLQLHIFEDRYRLMIGECIEREAPFGVVLIERGREVGGPASVHSVGTTARIQDVTRLPDGRMNIVVVGERRFRVRALDQHKPFMVAQVALLPPLSLAGRDEDIAQSAAAVAQEFRRYERLMCRLRSDWHVRAPSVRSPTELAYLVASAVESPDLEKQTFLVEDHLDQLLQKEGRLLREQNYRWAALLAARQALDNRAATEDDTRVRARLN
jgi:Lon protease-like protein